MINLAKKYIGIGVSGKLDIMDYYNQHVYPLIKPSRKYRIKQNDNWCACFVSVIANMSGANPAKFPYEVSVGEQLKLARERGIFTQNMELAKSGDLIIFNWNGDSWPDHVGFVESVKDGIVNTVEGNFHGSVGERHISMKSHFIVGVIQL